MEDDKICLHWNKFSGQLILCLISLLGGIYASLYFFVAETERSAFANTDVGFMTGVFLTMGTFFVASWALRVPYKKDMFERRLRNWSMTYAASMVLSLSLAINIGFQAWGTGDYLITPYMMPGLWLVCYVIYSQYTRYCIANGRRNSFLDGSIC